MGWLGRKIARGVWKTGLGWIHMAKHAGEGDVKTSCEIIKTRNNTLLRQLNGAKMSIKFFNVGERKMGTE